MESKDFIISFLSIICVSVLMFICLWFNYNKECLFQFALGNEIYSYQDLNNAYIDGYSSNSELLDSLSESYDYYSSLDFSLVNTTSYDYILNLSSVFVSSNICIVSVSVPCLGDSGIEYTEIIIKTLRGTNMLELLNETMNDCLSNCPGYAIGSITYSLPFNKFQTAIGYTPVVSDSTVVSCDMSVIINVVSKPVIIA